MQCSQGHFASMAMSVILSVFLAFCGTKMDIFDRIFTLNRDWDPSSLQYIFSQDFYEFRDLWVSNVCDEELVKLLSALSGTAQ